MMILHFYYDCRMCTHPIYPPLHIMVQYWICSSVMISYESTIPFPPLDFLSIHAIPSQVRCVRRGAFAVHSRCIRGAFAVHLRCIRGAFAVHSRCIRGAFAVYSRCIRGAFAVYSRCIRGAFAVHLRCTFVVLFVRLCYSCGPLRYYSFFRVVWCSAVRLWRNFLSKQGSRSRKREIKPHRRKSEHSRHLAIIRTLQHQPKTKLNQALLDNIRHLANLMKNETADHGIMECGWRPTPCSSTQTLHRREGTGCRVHTRDVTEKGHEIRNWRLHNIEDKSRTDRKRGGGAIFIEENISYERTLNIPHEIEGVSIKIRTIDQELNITTVYLPPAEHIDFGIIKPILASKNLIICVDMNAKNSLSGSCQERPSRQTIGWSGWWTRPHSAEHQKKHTPQHRRVTHPSWCRPRQQLQPLVEMRLVIPGRPGYVRPLTMLRRCCHIGRSPAKASEL